MLTEMKVPRRKKIENEDEYLHFENAFYADECLTFHLQNLFTCTQTQRDRSRFYPGEMCKEKERAEKWRKIIFAEKITNSVGPLFEE